MILSRPVNGARHAHGAHRGFGARADEPHPLERRHQRPHALAELDLERARRAVARAVPRGRGERLDQARAARGRESAAPTT